IQADPTSGTDGRDDVFVALCHLQHASTTVRVDQQITAGEMIGRCGNTGNSTEPHLHLQAMTAPDATRAEPLPITFADGLPRGGQISQVRGSAGTSPSCSVCPRPRSAGPRAQRLAPSAAQAALDACDLAPPAVAADTRVRRAVRA